MVPRHGFTFGNPTFSHWIFENLPQVRMYFEAIKEDQSIKILIGSKMKDWQTLSLKLLGINHTQILENTQSYCVEVENLYLCQLPYIHTNDVQFDPDGRKWVAQMLRKSLKIEISSDVSKKNIASSQKIAISRLYCPRRHLIDEKHYWKILKTYGFNIVFPEKISELDKMTTIYNARVLFSLPSGSAIANMIYSKDAHIVEILPDSSYISVWFLLSRELEFDYSLILAKTEGEGRDNDYEVSEEQILEKISNL
jgi:capsular polysaccharide biosynthesis protein